MCVSAVFVYRAELNAFRSELLRIEPDPMTPDGMALCLACGFCCDGMLHTHTITQADEMERMAGLGVILADFRGRTGFSQPCPLHQAGCCTAYAARPAVCRAYECALFKRYMAGALTWPEALAIVQDARDLRASLRRKLPDQRSFRGLLNVLMAADDDNPPAALDDAVVLTEILALATQLHRYFDDRAAES